MLGLAWTIATIETIRKRIELKNYSRGGDDDLGVNKLLVELAVFTLLVGGGHQSVALLLDPLPDTELVLGGSQKLGFLCSVLTTLEPWN